MLEPNKFTDPHNCVIYNSYVILKFIKKRGSVKVQAIRKELIKAIGKSSEPLLIPAIDFLFLLGKINYNINNDTLECSNEIK